MIRSARSERFFDKKYRKIAYSNLEKYEINRLIVLGGDGSFRALDVMNREFDISLLVFLQLLIMIFTDRYMLRSRYSS